MNWGSELLQRLQEVRAICKTRNQLDEKRRKTMISSRNVRLVWWLMLSLIVCGGSHEVAARNWKPSPAAAMIDYTIITHLRSPREQVFVWWIAPEIVKVYQETTEVPKMLREYLLVGVAHVDVSRTGTSSFRTIKGVKIKAADGTMLQPLPEAATPPEIASLSTHNRSKFVQLLGQVGQGLQWFTFKNKGIDSCKSGRFWIVYAGEEYEYKTPIPGCK